MSQHTFKKWKPGVWQAVNTGLYTLDDEEEDEDDAKQGICHPTVPGEQHHSLSEYSVSCLEGIMHMGVSLQYSMLNTVIKHTFQYVFM